MNRKERAQLGLSRSLPSQKHNFVNAERQNLNAAETYHFSIKEKVRWLSSVKFNLQILASFNSKEFTTCGEPRASRVALFYFYFLFLRVLTNGKQGKPEYVVVSGPSIRSSR